MPLACSSGRSSWRFLASNTVSINRPGGFSRIVQPSGVATRGGVFTPTLSGSVNPFPGALHGLSDAFNWGDVRLVNDRLHGTTVSGGPPYDDSIMLFPGTWGDDVRITATLYRTGDASAASSQEVELLLCGEIGPFWAAFYECMISVHASNIYADIIRWNGGGGSVIANYTFLKHQTAGVPAVANGNVFRAEKVGNIITTYLDSGAGFVQMATADITTDPAEANAYGKSVYTRGMPGIGFFQRGGTSANLLDFGATNLQISAL
jgi:hypothetical protein